MGEFRDQEEVEEKTAKDGQRLMYCALCIVIFSLKILTTIEYSKHLELRCYSENSKWFLLSSLTL